MGAENKGLGQIGYKAGTKIKRQESGRVKVSM
jgi:hypothetical protein